MYQSLALLVDPIINANNNNHESTDLDDLSPERSDTLSPLPSQMNKRYVPSALCVLELGNI